MTAGPPFDLGEPPREFDALLAWFDRVSQRLVLQDDLPLPEVRRAVAAFTAGVTAHRDADGDLGREARSEDLGLASSRRILRADHDRLATSVRQLWWFYEIVERDDHGGNRQALGQYGRIAAEALRRHRVEELEWFRLARTGRSESAVPPVASNDK